MVNDKLNCFVGCKTTLRDLEQNIHAQRLKQYSVLDFTTVFSNLALNDSCIP
jgi:hypothetical protein